MIIRDGKKIEINIGGISKSQLEKILAEHGQMVVDGLSKQFCNLPKLQTSNNIADKEFNEETEIKSNSLDRIANVMSTSTEKQESNFDNKIGNITTSKKDVSKAIDILKNID